VVGLSRWLLTLELVVRILAFGTYDVSRHPRIGIVIEGLRASGDEVVEVNEPLGFDTSERVDMLARPWTALRLAVRIAATWWTLAGRARRAARSGPFDAVVIGYMGHFDVVLARVLFPRTRLVLDQLIFAADTARDRGLGGAPKLRLLDGIDRLAMRCANVVMVDTEESLELVSSPRRSAAVVVPVGAPRSWFEAGAEEAADKCPTAKTRVVFFGLFTPLQGAPTIGGALAALSPSDRIQATVIGHGQDLGKAVEAAEEADWVTWIDWVDPDVLPKMVAQHEVCLGIFGTTPKALRVVPNKVYQGAAAGCAVVTSDTPAQRRILGPAGVYVTPGDAAALASALRSLAADPQARAERGRQCRSVALTDFSPERIVTPLRIALNS
jgi:glycosyltransferase involved in cell wall biosynthesis